MVNIRGFSISSSLTKQLLGRGAANKQLNKQAPVVQVRNNESRAKKLRTNSSDVLTQFKFNDYAQKVTSFGSLQLPTMSSQTSRRSHVADGGTADS